MNTVSAPLDAVIRLESDAIFGGSILHVTVQARRSFVLRVTPDPLQVLRGGVDGAAGALSPLEADSVFSLEYITSEAFVETRVTPGADEGPAFRYGMRFFPFFSSTCLVGFAFDAPIVRCVLLDLPDEYRMVWYGSAVESGAGRAGRQHSFGGARSTYIFRFSEPVESCTCRILLRLGGRSLTEIIRYPLGYWLLAMLGLAVLYLEDPRVIMGAVATLWAFMLREWRQAKLPQRNTLLTRGYLIAAATSLLWAALWKAVGLAALGGIPIVLGAVWWVLRAARFFEERGTLPGSVAGYWQRAIRSADEQQRRAGRRDG